MKTLTQIVKTPVRLDELYESVEVKMIQVSDEDADRRICAAVRALIEIDEFLMGEEPQKQAPKEAS